MQVFLLIVVKDKKNIILVQQNAKHWGDHICIML